MLYQDSLTAQTDLSDSGALPAPRHMAAQTTDQTLSNAKTATTASNRNEVGVAATWNGEKIYVTAFYSNLKTVLAARPNMWSFHLHGHFHVPVPFDAVSAAAPLRSARAPPGLDR